MICMIVSWHERWHRTKVSAVEWNPLGLRWKCNFCRNVSCYSVGFELAEVARSMPDDKCWCCLSTRVCVCWNWPFQSKCSFILRKNPVPDWWVQGKCRNCLHSNEAFLHHMCTVLDVLLLASSSVCWSINKQLQVWTDRHSWYNVSSGSSFHHMITIKLLLVGIWCWSNQKFEILFIEMISSTTIGILIST